MKEEWLVDQSVKADLENTKVARKYPTCMTALGVDRRKFCDDHQGTLLVDNKIHLSVLLSLPKDFTGAQALQGREQG